MPRPGHPPGRGRSRAERSRCHIPRRTGCVRWGYANEDGLERIPREVKRFIAEHIDSVGQLEVLLMIGADPDRQWSASEVSAELRSDLTWAEVQLEYLRVEGLLVAREGSEPTYRYRPARPELQAVVTRLGEAFEKQRADVIKLIFSQRPSERLRAFSEAFRLRKEQ